MTTIINGAPMTYYQGIDDKSKRKLPIEPEVLPTHLPKVYLFAQKGPSTPQLVVGGGRNRMYGDDTFDLRKPFATHQTVLSNLVNAEGNAQMIERLIPNDAGPKSNFLLSIDLLQTSIPQYKRDTSGKVMLDSATGLPEPVANGPTTVPGYKVKWVMSTVSNNQSAPDPLTNLTTPMSDSDLFGIATGSTGDQTDGANTSVRYPILQFWANSQGSYFNNSGLRIWAPTVDSTGGVNTGIISSKKVYPFRAAVVRRASALTSARPVETESGEPGFDFCLKTSTINPATDAQFYFSDLYLDKYENTKDKRFPAKYADLNGFKLYQDNIDTVLELLHDAESNYFGAEGSDFVAGLPASEQMYLYNIFSLASSNGAPYYSASLNTTDSNSVRLSESTNLFAKSGSDGTMTSAKFNELVSDAVSGYNNPNSNLLDTAVYPESIIYDTGFSLSTKYALVNFISIRKDTAVVLATYEVDGQKLTASEDHSVAIALRTRLQMFPESDYFGTAICRGMIIGRHGILRNSQYTKRLPLTLELAVKSAKMMGAGNGKWKVEAIFDRAPTNEITLFDDVSATFTPANQRYKDWDVGLNYAMSYSRQSLYFPALKTAYNDDTSVLNSYFTMMACVELEKVGDRTHRRFTGSTTLTDAQLIERVNQAVDEQTIGRFAGLFKIKPQAYISAGDEARGYSWSLPIEIYANNMKTAMTLSIVARRMSDYVAA